MIVLSLFDYTGIMVQPWAETGHECICIDIQHPKEGRFENGISFVHLDLSPDSDAWETLYQILRGQEVIIFGFPVCTDLSYSGAKHWAGKREADPMFQQRAIQPAIRIEELANRLRARYFIENPKGALAQMWRKPDFTFDPYEYGGYLPPNDIHPVYPKVIPPRDAYQKLTYGWCGNGFVIPRKQPVEPQFKLYRKGNGELLKVSQIVAKTGGDSMKTKNIRSATPRGFSIAVYYANVLVEAF